MSAWQLVCRQISSFILFLLLSFRKLEKVATSNLGPRELLHKLRGHRSEVCQNLPRAGGQSCLVVAYSV